MTSSNDQLERSRRGTKACRLFGIAVLAASVAFLAAAVFYPIQADRAQGRTAAAKNLSWLDEPVADAKPLIEALAGRTLIKASGIQAAVKDSGASKELLKRLKLQGVVEMPEGLVAYIAVQGEGVATCRKGQKVLEFVVEDIAQGKVVLNLGGVQTTLSH